MNRLASSLVAALALAASSPVLAAPPRTSAPQSPSQPASTRGETAFSVWGVLDPSPSGVGVGARVTIPIADGVIHDGNVRDDFTLEFGADYVHVSERAGIPGYYIDYSWNALLPVVGVSWNFWLSPRVALYPKLDLGYWIGWFSGWNSSDGSTYGYTQPSYGGVFFQGAAGLVYRLDSLALRVEAGTGLLRIGAGFNF